MTVACCWCTHALWCRSLQSGFILHFHSFFPPNSLFCASAAHVIQTLSNNFHMLVVHWQILSVGERDRKERIISQFDKSPWSLEFDWQLIAGVVWHAAANKGSMCGCQMMRFRWAGLLGSDVWQPGLDICSCSRARLVTHWSLVLLRRCSSTSIFTSSGLVVIIWLSQWLALKWAY